MLENLIMVLLGIALGSYGFTWRVANKISDRLAMLDRRVTRLEERSDGRARDDGVDQAAG